MDYQKVLTKAQFEAVTSCFGPMCILAGAGTGKTRVITHRIAWLIQEKGVYPENILGVTFTNKAAREMAQRVESLVPGAGRRVQLGTFHGTAAKLLRRYGYLIGVSPDFVIYDEEDALRLVKGLWERDTGAHVNADHRLAWRFFENWRQEAEGPPPHLFKSEDPFTVKCVRVFQAYEDSLKQMSALDFSGLLVGWHRLLCHEGARQRLGSQVKHLLVDEYQDTNPIQAQIVYKHAEYADSISVVGDDDQSIYSWRGAVADNMKQFLNRLEGAQLIKLEENHRSTTQILQAANSIITKNTQRLGKDLRAMKEDGPLLLLARCNDDRAEAQKVTHLIQEQLMRGVAPSEIAILVRTHADSRNFEESLTKAGIPYQLVGGTRFYARREIKDVLAMLRCAVNPQSDIDLLRAMTAIPRGIGQTTIKKMLIEAQKTNDILFRVMSDETRLTTAKISVGVRKKISRWVEKVTSLRTQTCALQTLKEQTLPLFSAPPPQPLNAKEAVTLAIELSGIGDHLLAQQDLEASNRLENLEELLSAAASYVEAAKSAETDSDVSVLGFLADATLATEQAQKKSGDLQGERIHLMTLHASKGLEFDTVFLSALEEFGFPHARSLQEDADLSDLEEERRLAYVGITRAKKELVMTWAARRMVRGEIKRRQSSRFLSEIDPLVLRGDTHHIHRKRPQRDTSEQAFFDARSSDTSHRRKAIENVLQRRHSPPSQDLSMAVELDPGYAGLASDGLQRGDRVRHTIFGNGKVLNVQGNGDLGRATILFERDGATRTIVLRYLEVLENAHSY